jgi:hypothetical protein
MYPIIGALHIESQYLLEAQVKKYQKLSNKAAGDLWQVAYWRSVSHGLNKEDFESIALYGIVTITKKYGYSVRPSLVYRACKNILIDHLRCYIKTRRTNIFRHTWKSSNDRITSPDTSYDHIDEAQYIRNGPLNYAPINIATRRVMRSLLEGYTDKETMTRCKLKNSNTLHCHRSLGIKGLKKLLGPVT